MTTKTKLLERFKCSIEKREWGGEPVYIRQLPACESEDWQFKMMGKDGQIDMTKMKGIRSDLVARCLCDSGGKPLMTKDDLDNNIPSPDLDDVFKLCRELNGMLEDSEKEAEGN